jgi:7-keto-8-aminopelargonate synthetase-like enzyme
VIYTTALPPPVVAAADAALDLVAREPERRRRLAGLSARLRGALAALDFDVPAGDTPIVPVLLGTSERAMACSAGLLERGVLVTGIRPPTVPRGTARLRVTLMATHTDADVEHAVAAFAAIAGKTAPA